jgi:hypothetical protein
MKSGFWLIVGVAVGFFAAHQVSKTPQGKQFFEGVDEKAREFGGMVVDGYKQREAELKGVISDAEDIITDLTKRIKQQPTE